MSGSSRWLPVRINIAGRLIVICLIMGLVPLLALGLIGIAISMATLQEHSVKNLQTSATLQFQHIDQNLQRVVKDAIFLSELDSLKNYLKGDRKEFKSAQREFLEFNRSNPNYYQVRFLGVLGHEIIRSNYKNHNFFLSDQNGLQFKGNRYYFQEGIRQTKGNVYFSDIDLNVEHGKIEIPEQMVIRVCAPVYIEGKRRGLIVINMFADMFFQWIELPGTPFTTLLLDKEGKVLYFETNGNLYDAPIAVRKGVHITDVLPSFAPDEITSNKTEIIETDRSVISVNPVMGTGNFNNPSWTLVSFFPKSYFQPQLNLFKQNLFLSVIFIVILGSILAVITAKKLTRPLRLIRQDIDRIAGGEFVEQPPIRSGDEIEHLSEKINRMKGIVKKKLDGLTSALQNQNEKIQAQANELRDLERQLYRADKLASLGELSMKLAHEIGNPLASLKTVTQAISEDFDERNETIDHLEKIVSEVDRLSDFLKKFNNFAILKDVEAVPCDIRELVRDVNFFLRIQVKGEKLNIKENFSPDLDKIMVDPQQIKQVLVNLILNAIQASRDRGEIVISVRNVNGTCDVCAIEDPCFCNELGLRQDMDNFIELSVCDNGDGIPKERLVRIFDPFYSTKADGTGLGLSVVHRIVEQHGGIIRVNSEVGKGATFKIFLPKISKVTI